MTIFNSPEQSSAPFASGLRDHLRRVRRETLALAEPLSDADATVQSAPEASPAKWHLAHTTWFFEAIVLEPVLLGYRPFHPEFGRLFNSYYENLGDRQPRPLRGLLSRPTLEEVLMYRGYVDAALERLLAHSLSVETLKLIELGLHHEQQHQELLLTDILLLFSLNPLKPVYRTPKIVYHPAHPGAPDFLHFDGGMRVIGDAGGDFAFDSEGPAHQVLLQPFRLASRPVSNEDWAEFIEDGGYRESPRVSRRPVGLSQTVAA